MGKDYVYELDEVLNRQNKNAVMEPALAYRYDQGDKTLKDYLALPEGTLKLAVYTLQPTSVVFADFFSSVFTALVISE